MFKRVTPFFILLLAIGCGQEKTPDEGQETNPEQDVQTELVDLIEEELDTPVEVVETEVEEEEYVGSGLNCRGPVTPFGVYLYDPGEAYTNVRSSPGGEVIMELPWGEVGDEYLLEITAVQDGWFKFENADVGMEEIHEVPNGFGWVHYSVVATDTRNYGNQVIELHIDPNAESAVTGKIEVESGGLRPLDACGDWVQVRYQTETINIKGWIKSEWLCGNPYTTCS